MFHWGVGFCCLKDCCCVVFFLLLPGLNRKSENRIEAGRGSLCFGPQQFEKQVKGCY